MLIPLGWGEREEQGSLADRKEEGKKDIILYNEVLQGKAKNTSRNG
jgi:hypothetical protein